MTRSTIFGPALLAITFAVGCGSGSDTGTVPNSLCGDESRADAYVSGIEKASDGSMYTLRIADVVVNGTPGEPDRGDNDWTIEAMDSSGSMLDGAAIQVKPWMPDHRHGTNPLYIDATSTGRPGQYTLPTFDLFMGGFWTFTFTVESGGQEDTVQFGFCVEG